MRRDDLCHEVRQRLKILPAPYASHYGVVPLPPPEGAIDLASALPGIEKAMLALAKVDALASQVQDPYLISRVLVRAEAVASSSIEGTNSTLDELLNIEEIKGGSSTEAARQVRDYALTLDKVIPEARQRRHDIFSLDLIRDLHRQVMREDPHYKDVPGELRGRVVWIGGVSNIAYSTFNPPPPAEVPECLELVIDYLRCQGMQSMTQGILTRMAIAHAQFEAIHPFRDGNGRVGRLLLPLMMAAEGRTPLYLSPYINANKDRYYDALKATQQRLEWHRMVEFLADAVIETAAELMATRKVLLELAGIWRLRRDFRRGSASYKALNLLPHYPVLTIGRLAEALAVSFRAASIAMDQLAEAGIVTERTGYARNRIFVATEALAVINRPFGAEPL